RPRRPRAPGQAPLLLAAHRPPEPYRVFGPGRRRHQPIGGRESNAADRRLVAGEAAHFLAGGNVPDPGGMVIAAGEEALAVGGELDGPDGRGVSVELLQ